jgi:hypothetical protein
MADVAEVVVRATPEGMDEVNEDIQQMEQGLADSTDEMDGSAEAMAALSQKFKGAMATTVAALAVGVGGILSQVPVMQELADSIGSVIDSIALKLDEKLRPTISDVTDEVYDFSDAIAESDSNLEILLEGIKTTFQIEDIIIEAGVDFVLDFSQDDIDPVKSVSKVIATWFEIKTDNVDFPVDTFAKGIELWIEDSLDRAKELFSLSTVDDVVDDIESKFDGMVNDAVDWGEGLIDSFEQGLRNKKDSAVDFVEGIVDDIRGYLPGSNAETGPLSDLKASGAALPTTFAEGITGNAQVSERATENALNEPNNFIGSVGGGATKVFLDGSRVDEQTGRYRKDSLTRRGA